MVTKQSFSILIWPIKNRVKDGKAPLSIRITINGLRAEIRAHREVILTLWDAKAQRVKGYTEEAKSLNAHLETIKGSLRLHESRLIAAGKTVTAELLKNEFLGVRPNQKTLCQVFDIHLIKYKERVVAGNKSPATLDKYRYTLDKIKAFLKFQYKISDILLEDIQRSFPHDLEFYLSTVEKLAHNTTMKYIMQLKSVLLRAMEMGWLGADPTAGFQLSFQQNDPIRLEMEELKRLATKAIPGERLAQVRDCYVFMCYTGFAYEDTAGLGPDNIFIGIDGHKWIAKNRQKTDQQECVPLLPVSIELIEKYKDNAYCQRNNKLLPILSNQKFNGYLKEIADICGINKNLTTHTARHTFATTVTLENDVPIETVSHMLGHRSIKTTQRYARVTRKKVSVNMEVLKNKLFAPAPLSAESKDM